MIDKGLKNNNNKEDDLIMNRVSRCLSPDVALRLTGIDALYLPEALPHVGQRPKA